MKHFWQGLNRYAIPLLFLIATVLLSIIYFVYLKQTHRWAIVSALGAFTAFLVTAQNARRDNDKFTKELFTEFNSRYNKMNEFLNSLDDTELNQTDTVTFRNKIYDYLNLCSEEYYWYHRGHIPELIWENWLSGIKEHLNKEKVRAIFYKEFQNDNNGKSYYGFLQYMEPFIKGNLQ